MKRVKKFLSTLAVAGMCLSLVVPAQAVEAKESYLNGSYQVHIFAGNQGTFEGGGLVKDYTGGVFNNDDVNVSLEKAEDGTEYEKYYVKGIKPSGSDVSDILSIPNFTNIDKDMDYVVVYGVRKDMVKYTINYLDADGNALAPSRTYEGNVGDKPIVPYLYIEGYMPQAYSLTKTLVKEVENNVFTFRYTRVTTGGGGGGGDRTVTTEEIVTTTNTTPVVVPGGNADTADGAGAGEAAVVPGDGAGAAGDAGAGAEAGGGEAAGEEGPQDLIDLDDEEVPLANVPGSNGGGSSIGGEPSSFFVSLPPAVIVGIVSMAVLFVAAAWFLIFKRKKKGTEEDEQK